MHRLKTGIMTIPNLVVADAYRHICYNNFKKSIFKYNPKLFTSFFIKMPLKNMGLVQIRVRLFDIFMSALLNFY